MKADAAPASQPSASAPLAQSLDQVITTLQSDKDRKALVDQLQTLRKGIDAGAASAPAPGLLGALAEAVDHLDTRIRKDTGPWHYWRWRAGFAGEEWHNALTLGGTRSAMVSLREFATVLAAWLLAGGLLLELGRRVRNRRLQPRAHAELPAVPSWVDVGMYMLRRVAPWVVAFALAMMLSGTVFGRSPASVAGMVIAYSVVAGAVLGAVCQVIFALFSSAHRAHAVRDLLLHSRGLLFATGILAALGDVTTDARVVAPLGTNLSALISTVANLAAALLIACFTLRFRRQIGQIIANRPLAFRQAHPAIMDLLRLLGAAWHLPVLAVVVASVAGTVLATGHADEFLRRTVASVALFVAALLLTLVTGRSPKATRRPPRIRDRQRSAYLARFGRFAVALVRVVIWFAFLELGSRIWGVSLISVAESTSVGKRISEAVFSVTSTVLLSWLAWLLVDTAITQTLTPSHSRGQPPSLRAKTILPLVRNALFVTLLVITLIVVLANLGVNVTPLLAGAGVVGLAIGFGAQSLVQDLITGLFIVVEDSIAVGDSVELPDHAGTVEAMTIRTVKLRDGKGALHVLPYSQIKAIKNLSRGYAYAVFNIGVAYGSDLEQAIELIRETGAEVSRDFRYARNLLSALDILGLDRFDPNGSVILAQFKTRPLTQAEITRAFNVRLKRKFDQHGISMATQRVTVQVEEPALPASRASGMAAGTSGAGAVAQDAPKPG
ncbi:mechanosensitive ion channel family protein [Cupriavidus basilensis]|uniref:Mechanosensitive ion channel family protein n=1 Tax=Cupriavidus basilensis TaxID=68895 RepID=A0ABT6AX99_9BURK|nr:mechanosensitive ion channel family protein [Cupriavidus basilensis]MDF3837232.1 mechanosensitive ion channel family protein [Cupriavidus basilensis]